MPLESSYSYKILLPVLRLVATVIDVHYLPFLSLLLLLDSMEKTYSADIVLALYLEKNSFRHMCCL